MDKLKSIPTWGWGVAAVIFAGVVYLATKGGASNTTGGSYQTSPIPAADTNDILQQLQDAANALGNQAGGGTTPTTPKPRTDPIFTLRSYLFDPQRSGIRTYNSKGKLFKTYKGDVNFQLNPKKIRIGNIDYYKIINTRTYKNYFVKASDVQKYLIPQYNQTPAPTVTSTTQSLPSSNNSVVT